MEMAKICLCNGFCCFLSPASLPIPSNDTCNVDVMNNDFQRWRTLPLNSEHTFPRLGVAGVAQIDWSHDGFDCSFWHGKNRSLDTVDGWNLANQLRLAGYPSQRWFYPSQRWFYPLQRWFYPSQRWFYPLQRWFYPSQRWFYTSHRWFCPSQRWLARFLNHQQYDPEEK